MTLVAVKGKKKKKQNSPKKRAATGASPKLEGWRRRRVQCIPPTQSKYQQEVATQTDGGRVSSPLFPRNFAQTPSNRSFHAEMERARSSEERKINIAQICIYLQNFKVEEGSPPLPAPLRFESNTDSLRDVLDYINPSRDPRNLLDSPLRLNAPEPATLHLSPRPSVRRANGIFSAKRRYEKWWEKKVENFWSCI